MSTSSKISAKLDEAAHKAEQKLHDASDKIKHAKEEVQESGFLHSYNEWRKSFGLKNPGTFESLTRDVRGVFA